MTKAIRNLPETVDDVALTTEAVACPMCGQMAPIRLFTERYELGKSRVPLGINRCQECRQIYVSPRLDKHSTDLVYTFDQEHTISHNYCWAGETSDQRFEPLLDRLTKWCPGGQLLDVGCGTGNFLAAAKRRQRWQLTGIEPTTSAAELARQQVDCRIENCALEEVDLPAESFDVIALLGVLEHLHEPGTTLQRIAKLLRPGGVLAVYVPNFNYLRLKDTGIACWLRRRTWSRLCPQEHLFQFTPSLLRKLLATHGFETKRLDVGRPFLPRDGLTRWFKQAAFAATVTLQRTTGFNLGGLEAIAQRQAN